MRKISKNIFMTCLLLGIASFLFSNLTMADPPSRVARLSYIKNPVTFSPAGEEQWAYTTPNRPLITGDRLWADADALAELQLGAATTRIASNTSLNILNLTNRIAQFQLAQGTLNFRVWRIKPGQTYEIDTPNLAFIIREAGSYRLDYNPNTNTTIVSVKSGKGIVYGENASYIVDTYQSCQFIGTALNNYQCGGLPVEDEFDRWCNMRDQRTQIAVSTRYVSPEIIGYEDLDNYGSWRYIADYGNVWVPSDVPSNWAPYRYGHWVWISPWGWTWVDDAPWGFAPFHYGRWAFLAGSWVWIPGPAYVEPVYAPALVAFVGGAGFAISFSVGGPGIAWFPLGPGDVYIPPYAASRNYFININNSNTIINNTYITNVYNNPNTPLNYYNLKTISGVTAVPINAFSQGKPVSQIALPISKGMMTNILTKTPVSPFAKVTPTPTSLFGIAKIASIKPSPQVLATPSLVKTRLPAPPVSFTAQQSMLAKNPGQPLDPQTLASLKSAKPLGTPAMKAIFPTKPAIPVIQGVKGQPSFPPSQQMMPSAPMPTPSPTPKISPASEVPHPPTPPSLKQLGPGEYPKPQISQPMKVPHPPTTLPSMEHRPQAYPFGQSEFQKMRPQPLPQRSMPQQMMPTQRQPMPQQMEMPRMQKQVPVPQGMQEMKDKFKKKPLDED